jgi:hypothetical protein
MDYLLLEHAIVAAVLVWVLNKAFALGFQGFAPSIFFNFI